MKPRRRRPCKPRAPRGGWLAAVALLAGRPEAEQVQVLSPEKVPAAEGQRSCKG